MSNHNAVQSAHKPDDCFGSLCERLMAIAGFSVLGMLLLLGSWWV